ncbi:MAG: heavy-metal-associated domain-containing protein [Armatimonadetes bacterium]|nr:heavy-metal-associated domain-containing protein [Armatimonadota bacterium]
MNKLVLRIPAMVNQASAADVETVLGNTPAVDDFEVDHLHHRVTLWTGDPYGESIIRNALTDAGYPAEED